MWWKRKKKKTKNALPRSSNVNLSTLRRKYTKIVLSILPTCEMPAILSVGMQNMWIKFSWYISINQCYKISSENMWMILDIKHIYGGDF